MLHKVGAAGKEAGRFIARKLGKIMDNPATTTGQKFTEIKGLVPLMEIGSSLALVYQEEPRLFSFLAHTIRSGKALDNTIAWFDRYLARLETELIAFNEARFPAWFDFFISSAHADITNVAKGKFVAQLRKLLDGVDLYWPDVPDYTKLAPKFNDALERFIKELESPDYKFNDVPNDMDVIRAFITVAELGSENSVKKFANHGGYTLGLSDFTDVLFIKAFAEFDLHKLTPDGRKAVAGLINSFAHRWGFKVTKGNIAHVLMIADMVKGTKYEVLDIEKVSDQLVTLSGKEFKGRRIDARVKIIQSGKEIDIEFKNWASNRWAGNLTSSMSFTPKKSTEAAEEAAEEVGQLYTDIVRYMQNNNSGIQWNFTPDVIESGVTKELMEDKIISKMEELIDHNNVSLAKEFNVDLNDPDLSREAFNQWKNKVIELKKALKGQGSDGQKFVQIYGFENINQ